MGFGGVGAFGSNSSGTVPKANTSAADAAKAAAGKADDNARDELLAQAISLHEAAEAIEIPPLPRILADDVTPEACASLLVEQDGRLAVISAEGGIFDIMAGRYSGHVPVLDVWLKGHSGDPLRVDRKGREPEYVERPALTLSLMVQPSAELRLRLCHDYKSHMGMLMSAKFGAD